MLVNCLPQSALYAMVRHEPRVKTPPLAAPRPGASNSPHPPNTPNASCARRWPDRPRAPSIVLSRESAQTPPGRTTLCDHAQAQREALPQSNHLTLPAVTNGDQW